MTHFTFLDLAIFGDYPNGQPWLIARSRGARARVAPLPLSNSYTSCVCVVYGVGTFRVPGRNLRKSHKTIREMRIYAHHNMLIEPQ